MNVGGGFLNVASLLFRIAMSILNRRYGTKVARIAMSILSSECRSLDGRTSDPMLDLCSRQLNRSTLDRLTPRVLEMNSKVK